MSNIRKTLQMTSLLFGMAVLFCYIAWHLGYDGFILVGRINPPLWFSYITCRLLFLVNISLVGSYILGIYSWKIVWYTIPLTIISSIIETFIPGFITSGPIPTLFFIACSAFQKTFKKSSFKAAFITVVTIFYQMIAIAIKTGHLQFQATNISMYTTYMFSIDMIIITLLIWAIGGEKNNGRTKSMEFLVFPGRIRDDRAGDESRQVNSQSQSNLPVGKFEVWVMRSVIAAVQILQWMFILWVCNLDNLFLDALVMTTSFICHGMIIAKRQHFKPIILCTLAATAMFYFAARFTISFRYSHFFPILVGLLLAYTVYRISYQFEKAAKEKARADLARIEKLEAQMSEAWKCIDKFS